MHSSAELNIGALARRAGVPAVTLRAWERRYGVPRPARTESGRRRYSLDDLALVVRMRQLVAEGIAPSVAARRLQGEASATSSSSGAVAHLARGYAERFVTACAQYDELLADAVLDEALLVYSVEQVCEEVIAPALQRIGALWFQEELPVAVEHIASALIRDRIASLSRTFAQAGAGRLAVLACAPGELHEIGPSILGLYLRRRGWRVLSLGQNTPIREMERVAGALHPAVLIVSATQPTSARQAVDLGARLASRLAPQQIGVALGGQGFSQIRPSTVDGWATLLPLVASAAVDLLDQAGLDRPSP